MKGIIWDVRNPNGRAVLQGLFWIGWGLVLASTYLIDHFGLFGMKQVYNYLVGKRDELPLFKTPTLYKIMRHPLYLGFVIAFWSTPRMTTGHLFFAIMTTAYTSWPFSSKSGISFASTAITTAHIANKCRCCSRCALKDGPSSCSLFLWQDNPDISYPSRY